MIMNSIFDLSRWRLLLCRHWLENQKRYLLSLLAIFGLLLCWIGLSILVGEYHPLKDDIQYVTYVGGLYIVGCFYASMQFADLNSSSKGIIFLSIPASHLEKLLCAIFYSVVLFFVVYTIIFYLVDIPMVKIANHLGYERFMASDHVPGASFIFDKVIRLTDFYNGTYNSGFFFIFIAYFPVQSAFILGSVYFTRYSFIKTTIALLFIWAFFTLLIIKVFSNLPPAGWRDENIASWGHFDKLGQINRVRISPWIEKLLDFLLSYTIPLVLWVVTYFRLKEKEV
jgi:hypothetical protein